MVRKFFPHDKNYLLEETQLRLQPALLSELVENAKTAYERVNNPLGLNDEFSKKIKAHHAQNLKSLCSLYENMAGIYRYKFGENQLDFLWDGKDHTEKYSAEWSEAFRKWTDQLCMQIQFVQAVLDLTVFQPDNQQAHMAENRMNAVMKGLFEVKIHRQKGIVEMRVA